MRPAFMPAIVLLLLCAGTASAQYCGSAKSDKYHRNSCTHAGRISPSNRIEFRTAAEAEATGRVPCKTCQPGPSEHDGQAHPDTGGAPAPTTTPATPAGGSDTQPAASGRCAATTKKGTPCKRNAEPGSKYCWQHAR
jgi:hypothetical protein